MSSSSSATTICGREEGSYFSLRDCDQSENVGDLDDVVFTGDTITVNVTERYRYSPIKVIVGLSDALPVGNNLRKVDYFKPTEKLDREFDRKRDRATRETGQDPFQDIWPKHYDNKKQLTEAYLAGLEFYLNDRAVQTSYRSDGHLTKRTLFLLLRKLLNAIYPVSTMGDLGVTCRITIEHGVVSYNMD